MSILEKDIQIQKTENEYSLDYCNHRFDGRMPHELGPSLEETFKHMYEIIDTNNLSHELTAHDLEVLGSMDDLPILSLFKAI